MTVDEETLFDEAVMSAPNRAETQRLAEIIDSSTFLEMFQAVAMAMRNELRAKLLNTTTDKEVELLYADFFKEVEDLYKSHYEAIVCAHEINELGDIRFLDFLKWYVRNKRFLEYRNGNKHLDEYAPFNFDFKIGLFRSAWHVNLYEVNQPLHTIFKMKEITKDTVIEETDWDGTKPKTGIEIIRRCGECGGIVISFCYIEDLDGGKKRFYFYSVSPDGKEMRMYKQVLS